MDKVKLEMKTPKNKKIEYNDIEIEITPFITLTQQTFLIERYIEDYFGTPQAVLIDKPGYHYLEAELDLRYLILQLVTNIDVEGINQDIYIDSILWNKIGDEIVNYYDFKARLDCIINEIAKREILENSIGKVVSNLIKNAQAFLDKYSEVDPDKLKEASEAGLKLMDRLEKTSVLKNPNDLVEVVAPILEKERVKKPRRARAKKE